MKKDLKIRRSILGGFVVQYLFRCWDVPKRNICSRAKRTSRISGRPTKNC